MQDSSLTPPQGIICVDKPEGFTSFRLVSALRRTLHVRKIGHTGTLDPFATGVVVLLVGRSYTTLSERLVAAKKSYIATVHLGVDTDSHDRDGQQISNSPLVADLAEIYEAVASFQGHTLQIPPMHSAKKQQGKKLYELARKGIVVDRPAVPVFMQINVINYCYPYLELSVRCSKGTYIRALARDLGAALGCGGHLVSLRRTACGFFTLEHCIDGSTLLKGELTKEQICSKLVTLKSPAMSENLLLAQ